MHKTFNFPINCYSPQIPVSDPEIVETDLGIYVKDNDLNIEESYEAFDTVEIIPSLIKTVEKMKKKTDEEYRKYEHVDLVIEWMKKWGYLKAERAPMLVSNEYDGKIVGIRDLYDKGNRQIEGITNKPPNTFYGQRVSGFVQEANKFYDFWMLYRAIANRDLTHLQSVINVIEDPELPFAATHTFIFFENKYVEYKGHTNGIFDEKKPLTSYQSAAIQYLTEIIEGYINNNHLYASQIRHSSSKDKDTFKLMPGMAFSHLLDVIYMQFFILLSENEKKICPICNTPFVGERKDKKYCSDTCKHTAKSRRYRYRQHLKEQLL